MGLSQRRRAKKSSTASTTVGTTQETANSTADCCRQRTLEWRTGNTLRRVHPDYKRELKRSNLLAFQVARKPHQEEVLMPVKPTDDVDIRERPNANRYNSKMIRLVGNDFTSDVGYSLNKRGRWHFAQQLRDEYSNSDALKGQNFYLIESNARPGRNCVVKRMTTNTMYIANAAEELRDHERKLRDNRKRHLANVAQFEFSEAVASAKTDRQLTHISGSVNMNSILQKGRNDWRKKPPKLSPSAELAHRELKDDFEDRVYIKVGTCEPGLDAGSTRYRMVDNEYSSERRDGKPSKSFPYQRAKLLNSMARKERRCQLELQFDKDGTSSQEHLDIDLEEDGEVGVILARRCGTISEAMQTLPDVSTNQAKKLALKALKKKRTVAAQRKKLRTVSRLTGASSGYDSASELSDGAHQAADNVDKRLSLAVQAELAVERPLMQVAREAADALRLIKLFEGAEGSLVMGNSAPRKLAVLLRPDLSESAVFEEAVDHPQSSADIAIFAVHYASSAKQITSAKMIVSQSNPFEFLRGLIEAQSKSATCVSKADASFVGITGWKRADAVMESDARLTAIRALPMFSIGVSAAAEAINSEVELVPTAECEICCQELLLSQNSASLEPQSLVGGSTMLNECGHTFCNTCWLQHVASSVAQGRVRVTCPGFKCQTVLDAATLLWFCPCDMLPALSSAAYLVWISARREGRQRRLCSQARCGRVLEGRTGFNVVCAACSQSQCLTCGQEPHWPVDCATAAKYHQKMKCLGHIKLDFTDLFAFAEVSAKRCPTCRAVIEKGIGCNHMTCTCGQHFCWRCGGRMEDHKNFPCQNNASSSVSEYFVEKVISASDTLLKPNSLQSRLYCSAVWVRLNRGQIQYHLSVDRHQITELFATYLFRFRRDSGSLSDRRLEAERQTRRLIDTVTSAVFLLEFAYVQADSHNQDRQVSKLVHTVGSLVWHLIESITIELREHCARGYDGPRRTRMICERLQMLLGHLESRCGLLQSIAIKHRDASMSVM